VVRELRRLLISPHRLVGPELELPLEAEELHYLRRVLRLREGERFALGDGVGHLWTAALAGGTGAVLDQPVDAPLQAEARPLLPLELAVALPKRDGELVLRMACELGFDRLTPLKADRSVPGPFNSERCKLILREAVEQCERLWSPELEALQPAEACLGQPPLGLGLLATTRHEGLPLLAAVLEQASLSPELSRPALEKGVVMAIGPEGGWSPAEEELAISKGWILVSLGPTILRSSTAAVAAAALLSHWRAGL
jgi:16S rRNA (uracil1498-N3)-methyltransferase